MKLKLVDQNTRWIRWSYERKSKWLKNYGLREGDLVYELETFQKYSFGKRIDLEWIWGHAWPELVAYVRGQLIAMAMARKER
jgi:hypothetical protein